MLEINKFFNYFFFLIPGKVIDFSNADVAADQYHLYEVSIWIFTNNKFLIFNKMKECFI